MDGLPVAVASTKTLAKAANGFAKKDPDRQGVFVMLEERDIEATLSPMALTDFEGADEGHGQP